jgi:hypothetical protein
VRESSKERSAMMIYSNFGEVVGGKGKKSHITYSKSRQMPFNDPSSTALVLLKEDDS